MKTVRELLEVYQHSLIKADDIEGQTYQSKADTRRPAKFPPEKDIPNVLTLVRKAIRVFPDNQKIALYYSYALDKYLSVPYGPNNKAMGIHLNEDQRSREKQNIDIKDPNLYRYYLKKVKGKKGKPVTDADVVGRMDTVTAAKHGKALQKAGQILQQKGLTAASAGAAFGTALRGGYEAGKRGITKVVRKVSSPSPKSMFPVVEEYSSPSQRFKSNLKNIKEEKQQLDEVLPLVAAGLTAARVAAPHVARLVTRNVPRIASAARNAGSKAKDVAVAAGSKAKDLIKRTIDKVKGKSKNKGKSGKTKKDAGFGSGLTTGIGLSGLADQMSGQQSSYDAAKSAVPKAQTGDFTPGGRAGINAGIGGDVRSDPRRQFGIMPTTTQDVVRQRIQRESTNFDKIKMIAESKKSDVIMFEDSSITINNRIAKKIVKLHESLNKDNKQKIENMLSEDVNSFRKIINFALRQ